MTWHPLRAPRFATMPAGSREGLQRRNESSDRAAARGAPQGWSAHRGLVPHRTDRCLGPPPPPGPKAARQEPGLAPRQTEPEPAASAQYVKSLTGKTKVLNDRVPQRDAVSRSPLAQSPRVGGTPPLHPSSQAHVNRTTDGILRGTQVGDEGRRQTSSPASKPTSTLRRGLEAINNLSLIPLKLFF